MNTVGPPVTVAACRAIVTTGVVVISSLVVNVTVMVSPDLASDGLGLSDDMDTGEITGAVVSTTFTVLLTVSAGLPEESATL